jgi:hypothetical protein
VRLRKLDEERPSVGQRIWLLVEELATGDKRERLAEWGPIQPKFEDGDFNVRSRFSWDYWRPADHSD